MKICYLDISASYSHRSLALPMLHLACDGKVDIEWSVVHSTINDDVHAISARVLETQPDVVLGTLFLFTHVQMLRTLRRVRAVLPETQIFLGGPEFLGENEDFLRRENFVDAVCRGEGELALPKLLQSRADKSVWSDLPGLCWLGDEGAYFDNGTGALNEDQWNELPPPSESKFFDWSKPFIQIETNRGCAQFCTFCTSFRTGPTRWSPLDRLRGVLKHARAEGVKEIRILDRTFNATPRQAIDRLRLFADEFSDLRFHLEIHPAFLPQHFKDTLEEMPDGLLHLEVGLQTTHPEALVAAGRAGKPEVNWQGLAFLCGLKNVDVHADLIGALPRLNLDHQVRDLAALSKLRPAEIQLEILKMLPGTPIARQADEYGVRHAPDPPYEVLQTPEMPSADVQTTVNLSRIVDRFFNQPVLQPSVLAVVEKDEYFYLNFLNFLKGKTDPAPPMSLKRRAQYLHSYLEEAHPELVDLVAYHWLLSGQSADSAVGNVARWKQGVPDNMVQVYGNGDVTYEGQIWVLDMQGGKAFFVFDRKHGNLPVAVFREADQTADGQEGVVKANEVLV
ncbi:MAG: DUF4080 domain-containing protein [Candidatus Latescibacteria bacterium]|jgi:radical SAM superfamily enzyme YgiQ (UPF0313 family)|nr:DUF4080 domain-containing protein [Candidatus Latescibacterota bacterium]